MLTHADVTVTDAHRVYEEVRGTNLQWVGFKDVGLPASELRDLADTIRADGRHVVMEVVSLTEDAESSSVAAALEIGVDLLMGGTHVDAIRPMLVGRDVLYFPFPGRVVGHPSILSGSIKQIADSAKRLSEMPEVDGLDLLAYRFHGDVPSLIGAVVAASKRPIVVAGSIDSLTRIEVVRQSGAWGFTVGSAVFDRSFVTGGTIRDQVEAILAAAHSLDEPEGFVTGAGRV